MLRNVVEHIAPGNPMGRPKVKKISHVIILTLIVTLSGPVLAMDADELIAKAIEAQGGKEKIQSIKTMKTTGKFMAGGMEFPFTTFHSRPLNIRIQSEVMGATMVQAFDGETGWMINPMMGSTDPQKMPPIQAKAFKLQADMDGPLIDWKKKGYTVEYIGTDDVEGTEVHHLKLDTNENIILDIYFDAEYFLSLKVRTASTEEGSEFEQDTFFSDYKDIDGMLVAHSIENQMGGQTVSEILIETVAFGVEVDPTGFTMPEVEKAATEESEADKEEPEKEEE
jgi:hypothetical protein